jgi:hypothetical protein
MKENLFTTYQKIIKTSERSLRKLFSRMFKGVLTVLFWVVFQPGDIKAQITAGFELDGNAIAVSPNPPDDWDLIYNNTSSAQVTTGIVSDLDNIFQGGGSKDYIDIPEWQWVTGSVPDKDNIIHGGVAIYNNCQLYFFADRYDINGSANIGIWLFKSSVSINEDGTFSGTHTVGDILLVSEFRNGGGVSVINAYKWVGGAGPDSTSTLELIPVNGSDMYAITNDAPTPSPWPYTPKSGDQDIFPTGAFFEGGIDLCKIEGLDPCFISFLIETRASFAINAVLKDFMLGEFNSTPSVAVNSSSRCSDDGDSVTVMASVRGGIAPLSYLWSNGNTTSSIKVLPGTTTTYTVTVTGGNGCVAQPVQAVVNVIQAPVVNAGPDTTVNCTNPSITITGSGTGSNLRFAWTSSGGNIVSGADSSSVTVDEGGTYFLTVTDTVNNCSVMDSVIVGADFFSPDANAGPDTVLTCVITQVTLQGSSATAGVTFSWKALNGGAIYSGGNTANPEVRIPGRYVLTVFNPVNGCSDTDTADVTHDTTAPNVEAGPNGVLNCAVTSISLNGSSTTPGATFSWFTSNGNIVSGSGTATPVVDDAGTYTLQVTNPDNGCTANDSVTVTLNNSVPLVSAGPDTLITCADPQVVLHGTATGVNFSWTTLGGNIVSGAATSDITVDAAGTYILTVTDTVSFCTANDTVIVGSDMNTPAVNAGPDMVLTCKDTMVTLSGSSTTAGVIFSWIARNGGVIYSGGNTANPVVNQSGDYILTVTDTSNGCFATDTASVTVDNTVPVVNLGNDISQCGGTVTLDAGNPGSTYIWNTGETTSTITVNTSGVYSVSVTGNNSCPGKDSIIVDFNSFPDVDLGRDTTLSDCEEDSLILNAGNAGGTYIWSTGATSQTIVAKTTGTYSVTVTNTSGCSSSDAINITIKKLVDLGPDTTACGCIVLKAGNPGSTYEWCNGQDYAQINVCQTGMYCVKVTTPTGCIGYDTIFVTIHPVPVVNLGNDRVASGTLTLDAGNPGMNFLWSTGDITQTLTVTTSGTYWVKVTSDSGCTAVDTINVTILTGVSSLRQDAGNVSVFPNPSNGNFIMDFTLEKGSDLEVEIFNSLGEIVYNERVPKFEGHYRKDLSIENNSGGMYLIRILHKGIIYTKKVSIFK